jgi:hypothetical protein
MAVPANKDELIKAINESYSKLRQELLRIPAELAVLPDMEGHAKGTSMSVNNLVSYLIGWGELVLKWNYRKENSLAVDFPETGFNWNDLGRLANKFYVDYQEFEYSDLLAKLDKVVADLISLVNAKSNTALYETRWYKKWPLGRMIQFNSASPYNNARVRIRNWDRKRLSAN